MAANPTIAAATGNTPAQNGPAAPEAESPAFAILRQYWPQLKRLLPSHVIPDAWYSAVFAALYRGRAAGPGQIDLWKAANGNPESLMFSLFDAARQGLTPGTPEYYLTPRNNRRATNGIEVLGIRGYQGEIELIYRGGAVSSVVLDVVRENDEYRYNKDQDLEPYHRYEKFATKAKRGKLKGVYAYARMLGGGISHVVELGQDDIDRAKRASGTAKSGTTFWNDPDDETEMWKKTAVHRLQKFVPTSAEYRRIDATTTATGHAVGAVAGKVALNVQTGAALPDAISAAQRAALPGGAPKGAPSPLAAAPEEPPPAPLDETKFAQPPAPEDEPDPRDDEPTADAARAVDEFWADQPGEGS